MLLAAYFCALAGSNLTQQANTFANSAASIAQSQAVVEQAQANQQMAEALQTQARTNTLNLLILAILLIIVLGMGIYLSMMTHTAHPIPSLSSPKAISPLPQSIYLNRPSFPAPQPELDDAQLRAAEILAALLESDAWKTR